MWLSKSKIKKGLQCPKALFLSAFNKDLAHYSSETLKAFNVGHSVGELARQAVRPFYLVEGNSFREKLLSTRIALKQKKVICEATFQTNDLLVLADLLIPTQNGRWNLVEVKSGTSLTEEYLVDVVIQKFVIEKTGLEINSTQLWYVNREASDLESLFVKYTLTDNEINQIALSLPNKIKEFKHILKQKQEPNIDIGPQCNDPYECEFKPYCWKNVPREKTIFQLPNFSQKWQAYENGIISLSDPRLSNYNVSQEIVSAVLEDKLWIDKSLLQKKLSSWTFPLTALDFETFQAPLLSWANTRPYQQIPFQASLHILLDKAEPIRGVDFLHTEDSDPRKSLVAFLLDNIPPSGSIVVYNKGLEDKILQDLVKSYPEFSLPLENMRKRIVDLWDLIKQTVYHPRFEGSYSLKRVVPSLLGQEYEYDLLNIKNGLEAQSKYLEMIKLEDSEEKQIIKNDLTNYCRTDTLNLILIFNFLKSFT